MPIVFIILDFSSIWFFSIAVSLPSSAPGSGWEASTVSSSESVYFIVYHWGLKCDIVISRKSYNISMTKNAQIFHLQYFQPNYRQFYTSSTLHDHQFHHRFQPTLNIIKLCQDLSSNIMSDREATADDVGFSFKGGRRNSKQVERSDKVFQHIKVEGKGREGVRTMLSCSKWPNSPEYFLLCKYIPTFL